MDKYARDLHDGIEGYPPPKLRWKKRLDICIDVARGLRFLHSQGLVHRDIKTKNVLVSNKLLPKASYWNE